MASRFKKIYKNSIFRVLCVVLYLFILQYLIKRSLQTGEETDNKMYRLTHEEWGVNPKLHTGRKGFVGGKSGLINNNKSEYIWKQLNDRIAVNTLLLQREEFCGGGFIGHARLFAVLHDVVLDPSKGKGKIGGENLNHVVNQTEDMEYIKLSDGYFNMECNKRIERPVYDFVKLGHLNQWMSVVDFHSDILDFPEKNVVNRPTIFVQRYDYAHLYFTMLDIHNAFLMCLLFDLDPGQTNIVWLDSHPKGGLDSVWGMLFGRVIRAGEIKKHTEFKTMIWNIMDRNGPINQPSSQSALFLEEFRDFVLSRLNINSGNKLNCSLVKITFVWRHDYVSHPRNMKGRVVRKIINEAELLAKLKNFFPRHQITGHQLDKYPMQKQLKYITGTDILIGMHGAGLTHSLFLPPHSVLVELFPTNYRPESTHFRDIARWRKLKYAAWNKLKEGSPHVEYTYVEPNEIIDLVRSILRNIC